MSSDGVAEKDLALLEQDHDGDARHRLGLRGDPEDGVGRHGHVRRRIELAESLEVGDLAAPGDERHRAAETALVDVRCCMTAPSLSSRAEERPTIFGRAFGRSAEKAGREGRKVPANMKNLDDLFRTM